MTPDPPGTHRSGNMEEGAEMEGGDELRVHFEVAVTLQVCSSTWHSAWKEAEE